MTEHHLNRAGAVASIISLLVVAASWLGRSPTGIVMGAAGVAAVWIGWVTWALLSLQRRVRASAALVGASLQPEFTLLQFGDVQRIDSKHRKLRVSSSILGWPVGTFVFWVNLSAELSRSSENRYLFSYTTDFVDSSGHPNFFSLLHDGGSAQWRFGFYGDPRFHDTNRILFKNAPNVLGVRLVAIRWNANQSVCDLLIDAGASLRKSLTLQSWSTWPKSSGEDIDIGGWRDNWDGGLSRALFTGVRLYRRFLGQVELQTIFDSERERAQILLTEA